MRIETYLVILSIYILAKMLFLRTRDMAPFEISVLDVGQGDAILIKLPSGSYGIVDGGANYEVDRYVSQKFIFNECRLAFVFLSHPHYDHLHGLNKLLTRCRVDNVFHYPVEYDSYAYAQWLENVRSTRVVEISRGGVLQLESDVELNVLWPPKKTHTKVKNLNNASLVFLINYKDFDGLFLGDLEVDMLRQLNFSHMRKLVTSALEFVKVSHHGAKNGYLKSMYSSFSPDICAISVGKNNKHKHPSQEVVEDLIAQGCHVKRTDKDGTIELFIN